MHRFHFAILAALAILLPASLLCPVLATAEDAAPFDQPPGPVGGMATLMQHIEYPKAALENGIEGKVLVSVVIDAAGQVKSATITTGVRNDLDQAALKAVRDTKWIPAKKDGRPVESQIIIPIQFKLEQKSNSGAPQKAPSGSHTSLNSLRLCKMSSVIF